MKTLKYLSLTVLLICLTACVNVPRTQISGNMNTGVFKIAAPKDGTLEGFQLTRLTNGAVQITIQKHTVRMNPDVIQQTAAGQSQLVYATLQGAGSLFGAAMAEFAKANGLKLPQMPSPQIAPPPQ